MLKKILFTIAIGFFSLTNQAQTYNFTSVDSLLNANLNSVFRNKVVCMVMHNDSLIYYYHQGADSLTTGGIASCTKTLSAALILRLVQEGTIQLDDSIAQYYPFTTALGKGAITLRQLYAHTSGLSGTTQFNANPNINLQQSADSILTKDALIYTPIGTKFRYTGEDQQVVGAAAELASGMSWDSLFAQKIAQPLGLDSTSFYLTTPTNPRIAGGINSNAADMLRFAQFILHNGKNNQGIQVVDSVLMQELWQDQTNQAQQIASPYPDSPINNNPYNASTIYYGFGTWLDIYNPTQQYQEQISAAGAFGGIIWVNRCTNMSGVFLTFPPSNYNSTYPIEFKAMDIFRNAVPSTCNNGGSTQLLTDSMQVQGITRKWFTQLPQNYNQSQQKPLVIALHGGLGTGNSFATSSGWASIADTAGFVAVFPNGAIPRGPGFVWNVYSWDSTYSFYNSYVRDDIFIDTLISKLIQQYNIDTNRIYLTGFSNGSSMVNTYAFYNTQKLAAIGAASGSFSTSLGINPYTNSYQPNSITPIWIWRGSTENQQVPGTLETRDFSDQNQKNYWIFKNQCSTIPTSNSIFTGGTYTYNDTTFTGTGCKNIVRFTSVQGQYHQFVPEYAERIWNEFFKTTVKNCNSITGINEPSNVNSISVFPNPFNSKINIQNVSNDDFFVLRNFLGQTIYYGRNIQQQDLSSLYPGIYFLSVYSKNSILLKTLKLMKQ